MKTIAPFVALTLLAALPAIAGDEVKSDVVAFNASVRVEVDATGKPVKVEAPADLPQAIRSYIEKRVASWQYLPAKAAGVSQPAVTYVGVKACAVPVAEGYRLGADFAGNGPRFAADKPVIGPQYPPEAERAGTEAEFELILGIEADGHVVIDQVERKDITGRAGASEFEPRLRRWVKTVRFDPELVGGKPVRGQVRMPVDFVLSGLPKWQALREKLQAEARASRECQMAAAGDDGFKPVAMNPAVTVTPVPAG